MQKIVLYRYMRPDGGVTVTPIKPDADYTELRRLVADEGRILTDGHDTAYCVDTYSPDAWTEIEFNQETVFSELGL